MSGFRASRQEYRRDLARWLTSSPCEPDRALYYQSSRVQQAQKYLGACLEGKGELIGTGNMGACYKVSLEGETRIVKIGSTKTFQSRHGYGPQRNRHVRDWEMLQEAAMTEEIRAQGYTCVPDSVFLRHGSVVAIVREYGEVVEKNTLALSELDWLADQCKQLVYAGIRIQDELLILRRMDGSLFIGDVGLWRHSSEFSVMKSHQIQEDMSMVRMLLSAKSDVPSILDVEHQEGAIEREARFTGMLRSKGCNLTRALEREAALKVHLGILQEKRKEWESMKRE